MQKLSIIVQKIQINYCLLYTSCQIGNNIIHNFKYTDKKILEYIDKNHFRKYQVNQGYSKCNTSVINDKVCITSDYGIYKTLNPVSYTHLQMYDERCTSIQKV